MSNTDARMDAEAQALAALRDTASKIPDQTVGSNIEALAHAVKALAEAARLLRP